MLRDEGIQFQMFRNPDVKFGVVEPADPTIRDRLYKYLTYINTFTNIDVLPKCVRAYNGTVHSTTSTAPWRVIESDVLAIWKRMSSRRIRVAKVKFQVGQHVRISKEKLSLPRAANRISPPKYF